MFAKNDAFSVVAGQIVGLARGVRMSANDDGHSPLDHRRNHSEVDLLNVSIVTHLHTDAK